MLSLFLIFHSGGQLEAQSFTDELTTESTRQYPAGGSDTVILEQFDKRFLESDQAYIGPNPTVAGRSCSPIPTSGRR